MYSLRMIQMFKRIGQIGTVSCCRVVAMTTPINASIGRTSLTESVTVTVKRAFVATCRHLDPVVFCHVVVVVVGDDSLW